MVQIYKKNKECKKLNYRFNQSPEKIATQLSILSRGKERIFLVELILYSCLCLFVCQPKINV